MRPAKRLAPIALLLLGISSFVSAQDRPWGDAYTTDKNKAEVAAFLSACSGGAEQCLPSLSDALVIGPALWVRLKNADAKLAEAGTPSTNSAPGRQDFEQRAFVREERLQLADSQTFRALVSRFPVDSLRPASESERRVYYFTIPFEITNEPLTVCVHGADVLLVVTDDGKAFWLEMVSGWSVGGA